MIFEINPLLYVAAVAIPLTALLMWFCYGRGHKSGFRNGQAAQQALDSGVIEKVEAIKQDFLACITSTVLAAKQRRIRRPAAATATQQAAKVKIKANASASSTKEAKPQ